MTGTVLRRDPHPTLPQRDTVVLAVDSTAPVPGLRDLVGPALTRSRAGAGGRPELELVVRRQLLGAAAPGWRLTCRARFTPNGLLAEPHPGAADFSVQPGPEDHPP